MCAAHSETEEANRYLPVRKRSKNSTADVLWTIVLVRSQGLRRPSIRPVSLLFHVYPCLGCLRN